jgi:predicted nucleic acid-binding protein
VNIFLDTTLFYDDPFLDKGYYTRKLIDLCEEMEFSIYISQVVIEETKNHLEKRLKKEIKELNKTIKALKRLDSSIKYPEIEYQISDSIEKFDARITELEEQELITVVDYNHISLNELIGRSIKRKKPFSDNKEEFRDAIIWLTYAQIAESENLDDCYFITNNKKDFWGKDHNVHPDLLIDSKRFKVFSNSQELFEKGELPSIERLECKFDEPNLKEEKHGKQVKKLEIGELELEQSISELIEEENSIVSVINNKFFDTLYSELCNFIANEDMDNQGDGYLDPESMDIDSVNNLYYEKVFDEFVIKCDVATTIYGETYMYNMFRDKGDDYYMQTGSDEMKFICSCSLILDILVDDDNTEIEIIDLEIDEIEVKKFPNYEGNLFD